MSALHKLNQHIKQKGLWATLKKICKHYVYSHQELLWMERDLVSPIPPHKLKSYPPLQVVRITPENAVAFTRYFGDRVETMAELAREGHTGHMHLDEKGDAVAFIWGAARHYHDRHYYGCWFPGQRRRVLRIRRRTEPRVLGHVAVDGPANRAVESHARARLQQGGGCVRVAQRPGAETAYTHGLRGTGAHHECV